MPLLLRFGADDLLRCRFAVSPLCETLEAVRMLKRRARHGYHARWLRRTRAAAAAIDLSPVWFLIPSPGRYSPDFLGRPPGTPFTSPASFEEELARVRVTDPAMAHEEITRSLACTPGAADSSLGRTMLDDPARTVQLLADVLEQAWRALVAPDWPRIRAVLEADIGYRSRKLAAGGLEGLFADLHRGVTWADGTLTVSQAVTMQQHLDGRGLLLMPSVFAWPDLVSGFAPPWQPTVIYPARGMGELWRGSVPEASGPLVRLLGPNRAAILAGLDEPASTTTLAQRYGLAPSSVSAHLTVLRDTGLLTSHRHGHEVLYERTPLGTGLVAENP